jgi:hypothetical protein
MTRAETYNPAPEIGDWTCIRCLLRLVEPASIGMRVSSFIEPCLPSSADRPPSGPGWVHEIKHVGFRGERAAGQRRIRAGHAGGQFILLADYHWALSVAVV